MNFKENETEDKLRGGYYTPLAIAQFLSKWVLYSQPKSLLEPSCGDGVFIRALEGQDTSKISVTGVEKLKREADKARKSAQRLSLGQATVIEADFLLWGKEQLDRAVSFDAIVGNPPYIRYQYLDEEDQRLAKELFEYFSLGFTRHTNAWVPFVIASIGLLAPGGRLAMVVPSELLHVLHARSLRGFLIEQSKRIFIIDPNELLFEQALQGTVLLMIEKKCELSEISEGVAVHSAPDNSFLNEDPEKYFQQAKYISGDILENKWMKLFLELDELVVFEKAKLLPQVKMFCEVATVDVGIVTGANKFFLVDDQVVTTYRLEEFVKPMFGRSEHCPGIIYDSKLHDENRQRGFPTNFLHIEKGCEEDGLPEGVLTYISLGEEEGLHARYKCRIRSPWFSVPSVYATPIGLLKRAHNFPRLILNTLGAYTTDTAYRISPLPEGPSSEKLVYCFVNTLTALSAELEGRHYGGGVLELVPSEIEKLLVPLPDIDLNLERLNKSVRDCSDPLQLLRSQDSEVLRAVGLEEEECRLLQRALSRIRDRRQRLLK